MLKNSFEILLWIIPIVFVCSGFDIFNYFILLNSLYYLIIGRESKLFKHFFFNIPFYGILVIGGWVVHNFLFLFLITHILRRYSRLIIFDKFDFLLILFINSLLISFLISTTSLVSILKFIFLIIGIIFLRKLIKIKPNIKFNIINSFIIGTAISVLIGLFYDRFTDIYILRSEEFRLIGGVSDPNYFARLILLSISLIFYKITINLSKNFDYLFIVVLFIGILLSISKMGLLTLLLISLIFFAFRFRNKLYFFVATMIIFIPIILLLINFSYLFPVFDRFIFSSTDIGTFSTGRTDLQLYALQKFFSDDNEIINLIFGEGFGISSNYTSTMINTFTEANVLHSIPTETLVEFGFFGFIILVSMYILFISKINESNIYIIVVYFLTSLSLSGFIYWDLIIFYLLFDSLKKDDKNFLLT